jgi:hypothetical protein
MEKGEDLQLKIFSEQQLQQLEQKTSNQILDNFKNPENEAIQLKIKFPEQNNFE